MAEMSSNDYSDEENPSGTVSIELHRRISDHDELSNDLSARKQILVEKHAQMSA